MWFGESGQDGCILHMDQWGQNKVTYIYKKKS